MEINWQDIFYITTSLTMIIAFVALIWLMKFLFEFSKLIKNIAEKFSELGNRADEIKYLIADVKLRVSRFLLKFLNKKSNRRR